MYSWILASESHGSSPDIHLPCSAVIHRLLRIACVDTDLYNLVHIVTLGSADTNTIKGSF